MAETATVQIAMPEMGESVTEGIVLEWHVAEGDFVNEGDTVVEVSTDKVDAEVPAPMDGVITKLAGRGRRRGAGGRPLAEMEPARVLPRVQTPQLRGLARGGVLRARTWLRSRHSPPGHPQVGAGNGWRDQRSATAAPMCGRRPWRGG